jgi:hypothetical protein
MQAARISASLRAPQTEFGGAGIAYLPVKSMKDPQKIGILTIQLGIEDLRQNRDTLTSPYDSTVLTLF